MPEPAGKPSLHLYLRGRYGSSTQKLVREHERSLHILFIVSFGSAGLYTQYICRYCNWILLLPSNLFQFGTGSGTMD